MFLQEAAPRLRLWYGRRGLAGRRRLEGVVAGRAAAEGRKVEGHFLSCGCFQCFLWCLWLLPRPRYRLAGSARHDGDL